MISTKLKAMLRRPWSVGLMALLGVLLNLPNLHARLMGDDFLQWSRLSPAGGASHTPLRGSLFGLFDLVSGGADRVQAMKANGQLLWTASDTLQLRFWRPVAEFTHWLDYQLWPDNPTLMHAHNLLWYGLLIVALGNLYRRLDPVRARGSVAAGLYAISGLHFYPVAWLAGRNQLISTCLIVGALIAHHLWRTGRGPRFAWLAAALTVLGLASAEAAVAILAYVLAYEWAFPAERGLRTRAWALLPYTLIVVAWRLFYHHAGYGAVSSGSYIDPGASTERFGLAMALRLPTLLLAEMTGTSAALPQFFSPQGKAVYAVVSAAIAIGGLWLMRRLDLWRVPVMRFYGLGTLLALVPVCAVEATDRVLVNAEIGMSGMVAVLVHHLFTAGRPPRQAEPAARKPPRLVGACAIVLVVIHVLVFPLASVTGAWATRALTPYTNAQPLSLPDAADTPHLHMVLINPPTPILLTYYPFIRRHAGLHNPASMQALATGMNQDLDVTVLDGRTLRLRSRKPFQEAVFRDLAVQPFKPGDVVRMGDIAAHVEAVDRQGAPLDVRFVFDLPLADPNWAFFVWRDGAYRRFALPPPGQTRHLPAVDLQKTVMDSLRRPRVPAADNPHAPAT